MTLTQSQLTTFGNHIRANTDPVVIAAVAAGSVGPIADHYNGTASPIYWVFRKEVDSNEVRDAINANDIANITSADRDRAVALLDIRQDRGFHGEDIDDRAAWDDIFSAAAGDKSQQAIAALWTKQASEFERVFVLSTGTGADAANADTTEVIGVVGNRDIRDALALTA